MHITVQMYCMYLGLKSPSGAGRYIKSTSRAFLSGHKKKTKKEKIAATVLSKGNQWSRAEKKAEDSREMWLRNGGKKKLKKMELITQVPQSCVVDDSVAHIYFL